MHARSVTLPLIWLLLQDGRCCAVTLCSYDLHVQMSQAASGGQGQLDHAFHGHRVSVQVVEQGAVLMVIGHQPQLGPCSII